MSSVPIFVINLDRAEDRLSRLSSCLESFGLSFRRVRAVEPHDISKKEMGRINSPRRLNGELSDVEVACVASHLQVWQTIVDRNLPLACVMEDDAMLTKAALPWLEPSAMPAEADILKLEGVTRSKATFYAIGQGDHLEGRVVFPSLVSVGSACYLITLEGARKAHATIPQLSGAIDTRLAKYWMTGLSLYEVHPFPVAQDGSPSSIKD